MKIKFLARTSIRTFINGSEDEYEYFYFDKDEIAEIKEIDWCQHDNFHKIIFHNGDEGEVPKDRYEVIPTADEN